MKTIQTVLLGRKVTINTDLHLHQWKEHEGAEATIESVHLVEGSPFYTLSLQDGTLVEGFSFVFKVHPAPAAK